MFIEGSLEAKLPPIWTDEKQRRIVHVVKICSISKNDGRRGTFEEDLQRCIFRGSRSIRDMFIRAAGRSGR